MAPVIYVVNVECLTDHLAAVRAMLLKGGAGIPAALAKLERLEAAILTPDAPTFGRFDEADVVVHDVDEYLRTGRKLQVVR